MPSAARNDSFISYGNMLVPVSIITSNYDAGSLFHFNEFDLVLSVTYLWVTTLVTRVKLLSFNKIRDELLRFGVLIPDVKNSVSCPYCL